VTDNARIARRLLPAIRWTIEPPPPAPGDHPGAPPREPADALRHELELGHRAGVLDRARLAERAWSLAPTELEDQVEDVSQAVFSHVPAARLSADATRLLTALEALPEVVVCHDLARGPWPHAVAEPIEELVAGHDAPAQPEGVVFTTWRDLKAAVCGDGLWLHAHAPFRADATPEASAALADRLADHLDARGLPTYRAPATPSVMVPIRWRTD